MQPKGTEYFIKNRPGESGELKTVDNIISQSGDFILLKGVDVIIKTLMKALLIAKGTYLMDPNLGSGIYKYIFEGANEYTRTTIIGEIGRLISKHLPDVVIKYDVLFFKGKKGFRIDFLIDYEGANKEVSITIDESLLKTLN